MTKKVIKPKKKLVYTKIRRNVWHQVDNLYIQAQVMGKVSFQVESLTWRQVNEPVRIQIKRQVKEECQIR